MAPTFLEWLVKGLLSVWLPARRPSGNPGTGTGGPPSAWRSGRHLPAGWTASLADPAPPSPPAPPSCPAEFEKAHLFFIFH